MKAAAVAHKEPPAPASSDELIIEWRDPATLRPHPQNSRKHDSRQLEQMRASLRRFGVAKPILIDEADTILAGHATTAAAVAEALARVPVIVARGWTDQRKRAYLIADNKLPEGARWNYGVLALEVDHLKKLGEQDFASLGFKPAEITSVLKRIEGTAAPTNVLGAGLEYRVVVDCSGEAHQAELLARFAAEGLPCRALIS